MFAPQSDLPPRIPPPQLTLDAVRPTIPRALQPIPQEDIENWEFDDVFLENLIPGGAEEVGGVSMEGNFFEEANDFAVGIATYLNSSHRKFLA